MPESPVTAWVERYVRLGVEQTPPQSATSSPTDAIVVAELVERSEQRRGAHRLAVDRHWIALLERDLDNGRLVWRILGMNGARVHISRRFFRRVLQNLALGRDVQEVRVCRKGRFTALVLGDRDLMLFSESEKRPA